MRFFSILGVLSPVHIAWVTLVSGARKVAEDSAGNLYYEAGPRKSAARSRRWVAYNGRPDASKVPPEFHGWLHHQTDILPSAQTPSFRRPWQKPHEPNRTGTDQAYRPPGHALKGGVRDAATGDYEAWQPPA